ncbi:MAG: gamma-glutamylcyclotransferase [Saccharospirillum sp.]
MTTRDPFVHHPELQGRIADPETSFYRTFNLEVAVAMHPEPQILLDWVHTDERREQIRTDTLADHSGDLWVFGYGSLMWDPGFRFVEVRRARVRGYARRLILMETRGARGTAEAPGLVAALDEDPHSEPCEGLLFRIAADDVDAETEILWRREVIAPGYIPGFIPAELDDGSVQALTFLADHAIESVRTDISHEEQVRCIATGAGFLGTSREYLANIVEHFTHLGIADTHCSTLLREADAYRERHLR